MRGYYPELEPYESGMLPVDDQQLYWETSGNPNGKPVIYLHGGPGGGTEPNNRRVFDPERYRIILVDQRGAGRSRPHASEAIHDLQANTTWHLVDDLERLREHLEVDRWQVFGGSWGSTLALAYAQRHPERVTELVLRGIFTARPSEVDWTFEGGAATIFPDTWEKFTALVPDATPGGYVDAYHRLLNHPDPAIHGRAATAWSTWEATLITLLPQPDTVAKFQQPERAAALARIENHYFVHGAWLEEGQLIRDAGLLTNIPGVIVQGRYDICTPPVTAWELHRAWPASELVVVADAGHAFDEPGILSALVEATDRFAG